MSVGLLISAGFYCLWTAVTGYIGLVRYIKIRLADMF